MKSLRFDIADQQYLLYLSDAAAEVIGGLDLTRPKESANAVAVAAVVNRDDEAFSLFCLFNRLIAIEAGYSDEQATAANISLASKWDLEEVEIRADHRTSAIVF